jgi:hypothetical protein
MNERCSTRATKQVHSLTRGRNNDRQDRAYQMSLERTVNAGDDSLHRLTTVDNLLSMNEYCCGIQSLASLTLSYCTKPVPISHTNTLSIV